MSEKVVFLSDRNKELGVSADGVMACGNCKNKAWTVVYEDSGNGFPRLKCTCCGFDGGRFGWLDLTA